MLGTNAGSPRHLQIGYPGRALPPEHPLEFPIKRFTNISSLRRKRQVVLEWASEGMGSRLPLLLVTRLHQILEACFGYDSVALGKLRFYSLFLAGDFIKLLLKDCFIKARVRILGCGMLSKRPNVFERELILMLIETKQRVILAEQALAQARVDRIIKKRQIPLPHPLGISTGHRPRLLLRAL
jgi:hypothetical protein